MTINAAALSGILWLCLSLSLLVLVTRNCGSHYPPAPWLVRLLGGGGRNSTQADLKIDLWPWLGGSVGWSIVPVCQSCRFDPQSGHIQEMTNECIDKWNNKSVSLKSIF